MFVSNVPLYGKECPGEVRKILKELCLKKIDVIYLYLNLEDPLTQNLCGEFEKLGFFIGGILPAYPMGETLILQYLNNVAFDYDRIKIASETGKEILSYVRAHDPNMQ
jgi:hypothetical protein